MRPAIALLMTLASAIQQVPVYRGAVDLVNLAVIVTAKTGALVSDLTADDFDIYEDGRKQTIRYFASGQEDGAGPALHLGLLLDVSESMGEDLGFTKTAAIKFLNTLTDAADITILDFDTEVRAARFSQQEFARVVERIRQKKAAGFTALYDAVGVYLHDAGEQDGRKIMLLYTDGGDTRSAIPLHELMDLLKASDVTVYPIGALEHQSASARSQQRMILERMAEVSGGQAFFPTSVKDLDSIYDKVVAHIRAQYTLGYLSTNDKADGTWRKVEIRLNRKDLRPRARQGYFAAYRKP
jgi:Ca-activated chloride channel family protein